MTGLGTAGTRERLLWPWLVVAAVAVAAAALLVGLVVLQHADARTLARPGTIGEWQRTADDGTTQMEEMTDLAMESLRPGVDVSTASYTRADGVEVKVGLMSSQDGSDLDRLVVELEDSTYGLVVGRTPHGTADVDAGPLGGSMSCGAVLQAREERPVCAWHDRTTAGAVALVLPKGEDVPDLDLAAVTRELREAMTSED